MPVLISAQKRGRRWRLFIAVGMCLLAALGTSLAAPTPSGAAGATFYVEQGATGTTCASTGLSAACPTVSDALAAVGADTGDTIDVAGTITDNANVSTAVTIRQWPGKAPAEVNGGGNGSVFTIGSGGNLSLDGVTVTGGNASNEGGGIDNGNGGALEVLDSTIEGNTASLGGGIASQTFSTVTVDDSTISGNSASGAGGGIFSADENLVLDNATLYGNTSLRGGGIYTDGAPGGLTADDSTIVGNVATATSSGDDGSAIESVFTTTVFAGDIVVTPIGSTQPACVSPYSTQTDGGYNIDSDGTCGFLSADHSVPASGAIRSYLGTLGDNGGPTPTVALTPGAANQAQAAIPATFTAPSATSPTCQQPDQRGLIRAVPCDMGAYALSVPVSSAASATFTTGLSGSFQVSVNGTSSATFTESGSLPSGVTLSAAGLLAGVPSIGSAGTCPITITGLIDGAAFTTQSFILTVQNLPAQPAPAQAAGSRLASTPDGSGYWVASPSGSVTPFGSAKRLGSAAGERLNAPIVGIAATPDGKGYWLVGSDGGVFSYGDAPFLGSMGGVHLNEPVVGMTGDPSGNGYWLVASDGGVFTFWSGPVLRISRNHPSK